MTLNCPTRDTLLSFTRGDLPDEEIEAVCDHLETCTGCEETVARFEGQSDTFIGQLQTPVVKSRFADEPEFDRAVAAAKAMAREPVVTSDAPADTAPAENESLGRIGDYQLLARLGHGGMGTVYRALHTRLRRVVAVKVLATHRRHDPAVVERFAREIEAVGKLSHRPRATCLRSRLVFPFHLTQRQAPGNHRLWPRLETGRLHLGRGDNKTAVAPSRRSQ
jgi:anti-sigma factor RsiW